MFSFWFNDTDWQNTKQKSNEIHPKIQPKNLTKFTQTTKQINSENF